MHQEFRLRNKNKMEIKMKKENQITLEQRIEELSKWDLELILLKLIEVDKHINVGSKTRREIIKAHDKEFSDVWGVK
jgi:hypothetical protein